MALRNLLRNRRRTLSTILAIFVGLVGITLLDGYITYSMNGLKEVVVHSGTGHLQIAASPAFYDEGDSDPFSFMLKDAPALETELRAMPEVKDVLPVLSFTAVLSAEGRSGTVLVTALPLDRAKANLDQRTIAAGNDLEADDSGLILAGKGLAKKLGFVPGAQVSLFVLNKSGGINTQSFGIAGTTTTIITAIDNVSVFMSLDDARSLIGAETVPQLIVFLKRTEDTEVVAARLKAADAHSPAAGSVCEPGWNSRHTSVRATQVLG
jgi:putative ABC transport system permease protein